MKILTIDRTASKKEGCAVYYHATNHKISRRYINVGPMLTTYARYLWMKYHPDDPIGENETIHHKDFDSLNDYIGNLEKLDKETHRQLHDKRKKR